SATPARPSPSGTTRCTTAASCRASCSPHARSPTTRASPSGSKTSWTWSDLVRAKITYFVLAAVLVVYFVLAGSRGVVLIEQGTPVTVLFGAAVLIIPFIGAWFLWQTTAFARNADRLARELEAEGGLPVDELV